jgi:hypothetical protein
VGELLANVGNGERGVSQKFTHMGTLLVDTDNFSMTLDRSHITE